MIGVNSIVLFGNLVRDPEEIASGKGTSFTIGFNTFAGKENDDRANYVTVKVWGNNAKPCRDYLSKGDPVIVSGKLELEQWEKDGEKRSRHTITAFQVQFLKQRKADEGDQDEIPF